MSEVTPVSEWKKSAQPNPLDLPSGKTCLVRPVGMETFIKEGLIPNSLLEIVQKALDGGDKVEEMDTAKIMQEAIEDPEKLQAIFGMADTVCCYCVVEPVVNPTPALHEPRSAELLYVDEVDLEDKLFILNFAMGGTRDLERFRAELAGGVGSVSSSNGV